MTQTLTALMERFSTCHEATLAAQGAVDREQSSIRAINEKLEAILKEELPKELEAAIAGAGDNDQGFTTSAKRVAQYRNEILLYRQAAAYREAFSLQDSKIALRAASVAELEAQLEVERARLDEHEYAMAERLAEVAKLNGAPVIVDAGNGQAQGFRVLIGKLQRELTTARESLAAQKAESETARTIYKESFHE